LDALTKYLILSVIISERLLAQPLPSKAAELKLAPLYKYHIFVDGMAAFKAFNLNFEWNVRHHKEYADNLRILIGLQRDTEYLIYYPKLQGVYRFGGLVSYLFLTRRKYLTYELSPGIGIGHGDPIARSYAQRGYGSQKTNFTALVCIGFRYIPKKFPITTRLVYMPFYDINSNRFFPIFATISLGYSWKFINESYNKKSSTNNCHTLQ
jgi:hypothetical protein